MTTDTWDPRCQANDPHNPTWQPLENLWLNNSDFAAEAVDQQHVITWVMNGLCYSQLTTAVGCAPTTTVPHPWILFQPRHPSGAASFRVFALLHQRWRRRRGSTRLLCLRLLVEIVAEQGRGFQDPNGVLSCHTTQMGKCC